MYWLAWFVNFTKARLIREEEVFVEEMPPVDPAVRHFLMGEIDGRRAQLILGGTFPWLVALVSIKKQAKKIMRRQ